MSTWLHTEMTDGRRISLNMDNAENFYPTPSGPMHKRRESVTETTVVMTTWNGSSQPRAFDILMPYGKVADFVGWSEKQ